MIRWFFAGTLQGFIISWSVVSAAQPAVVASTLFQQAVSKMEVEEFSEACPLLEESYRLDAKSGTLFTLANCRDREGKVVAASARYGEYLRAYANMTDVERQKHASRAGLAESRVHELEPQLPSLKLTWNGELAENVKILVDDIELSRPALTLPLPLDPGPHEIVVQQLGAPDTTRTVILELGHSMTFDLNVEVVFVKHPKPKSSTAHAPLEIGQSVKSGTHLRKKAGFITLGVGGASLVFGSVMGALALAEKQTVETHCNGPSGYDCDATGFSAVNRMRLYTTPSTVGFVAAGVLAAAGVVLVVTAPNRSKEKPTTLTLHAQSALGGGFVGVEGTF